MAGVNLTITVDDAAVRTALGALIAKVGKPAAALRDIGEYLLLATDRRFRAQAAPDGTPWAPNSDVTLLRHLNRGGKGFKKNGSLSARGAKRLGSKRILRDSGLLQGSIRYQLEAGGAAVAIGTNRIYGAMQQFGGTRAQWPHLWGDIPARRFLGLAAADREEIRAILRRHLNRTP
ncbi:phage virion morphogenesis protein [Candidatus Thiodictyon syntrophicum]|jgi:phage virion morphogenesis protein|nr:phage virion morphogenesis protein [Candidatus Thiodictyon syntrophicum]